MKKNRLFLGLAAILSLVLLIPALIVPSMGATISDTYYNFISQQDGASAATVKSYLGGITTYPSTATVATLDGNKVLKIDSKPVDTGTVTDFIYYGGRVYDITWADDTKASGTAKYSSTTIDVTSADGGATVVASDKTYTVYSDAATREVFGGGSNIDKNVTVGTPLMAYDSLNKIILQADYYIPSDSKGTFESQIYNYKLGDTSKTWLNLYTIEMSTGTLKTGVVYNNGSRGTITLEKDVWNTISLVIDLDSGAVTFYVNGAAAFEGAFTVGGNLTFNAGNWIVAKLNKNTSGLASDYAGSIYIDNILCQECTSGMEVDLDAKGALYADMTLNNGNETFATGKLLANKGVSYTPVLLSDYADAIAPVEGASIRLSNTTGIRFATQVNTAKLNELVAAKTAGKIKNVEIGTLITPYTYVTEAGDFTVDALKTLSYSAKYLDVKASIGGYFNINQPLDEGYDNWFVGSIIDIRPGNRSRLFTGVGYVKITMNDGTVKYIYSYDYTDAATQEAKYSRSISYIASVFVNDPAFAEYQELLQSFVDGATVPEYTSSIIQNVQYSYNEFFFQNAAGVACQLLYDGNNGWRLQAVNPTQTNSKYNEFNNMGAAQALSQYLGEAHDDKAMKLTVTNDGSKFIIRAEGTESYATLNITGSFNLQFFSPDGVLMNNVSAITADGSNVTLTGSLNDGEAVYGGGETFNASNKRGQTMSLYSYDAYNSGVPGHKNEAGTYTVIPLFTFTRGSGMFINRYEIMSADWGNTTSDQWTVSIQNDLIDCYFYATGNMLDAIYGYTDLAGHATLPEEWAQGVLICRYSPDFNSLNGETMMFDKLEAIPGYETLTISSGGALATTKTEWTAGDALYSGSTRKYIYADGDFDGDCEFVRVTKKGGAPMGAGVKAIIEGLIEAGMKPTAMVLEGLGWGSLGTNQTQYENFVEVINYCEEQGINTTLYMAVGNISSGMPGYKKEYQVTANVTYNVTTENGSVVTTTSSKSETLYNYDYTYETTTTHGFTSGTETTIKIPKNAASDNPDAVGSGTMSYLDITNPEAVDWYMDVVWGQLIELGVDGCKIDFCEIMPNEGFTFDLTGTATTKTTTVKTGKLTNKSTTSESTSSKSVTIGTATLDYLWYDDSVFEGDDIHHAYSSYFISLFCQRMNEKAPEGFVVLNRGGGIGMQRNPYMWAGDQVRNELTLSTQLAAVLNSGISGLPFMTYDMAGYAYSGAGQYWNGTYDAAGAETMKATESEIFIRAIQYSAFSLMIQTHGDVRHLYDLSEEAQTISSQYTALHGELMDYIQKYSAIACETGMPVLRLLVLHYQNDANVYDIQDEYMFGDGLLVAPILTLGSTSRDVYLPEGTWIDLLTGTEYVVGAEGKTITVNAKINQIPVFLNANSEDAKALSKVFNGETWQKINGGVKIPDFYSNDNAADDIFGK
ncbi:MAG: glycoside hydrolase family 31 protein [Clostridia bacterium]|nr:glycoside hydrolase family 31 protein [Clostridia bacterium]MBQ9785826.1 glycoside hydrolase family 31 protein [Clostridia bacterium]